MLQPRFWQLLFFGLLSSFAIYSIHFSNPALAPKEINSKVSLRPATGKFHVLLTQGASFVGSHVALALLEAGHAVTLVDDPHSSFGHLYRLLAGAEYQAKVLSCDQAQADQLQAVLSAAEPAIDVVLHLAPPGVTASPDEPIGTLAISTNQILAVLKAIDSSNITKLIVASSYSVYDTATPNPVDESAPCSPTTSAGHAALFTENVVKMYASHKATFQAAVLRHAQIMGADPQARLSGLSILDEHGPAGHSTLSACAAATQKLRQQQYNLPVPDSSTKPGHDIAPCSQDYVHVMDLAAAFLAVISKVSQPPAVYNVGSGQAVSHNEVLKACQRLLVVEPQVLQRVVDDAACYGVIGNITKIQTETDWRPRYQLDDALKHAV